MCLLQYFSSFTGSNDYVVTSGLVHLINKDLLTATNIITDHHFIEANL